MVTIGELLVELARDQEAIGRCREAVTIFAAVLTRAPDDISALINRGHAFRALLLQSHFAVV